jgi:RND family efflux transporter MFP subunit
MLSMAAGEEPKPGPASLELVGSLSPARLVKVESSIPGRVNKVHVEVGDRVRAGDSLAELDDGRYRSEVALTRARMELAKARYREVSAAVAAEKNGQSPGKERLAVAEAEVKRAEAALAVAEHKLDETVIRARIDGKVLKRTVGTGDAINPSDPEGPSLFELADLSKIVAVVNIPESHWRGVRMGQVARVAVAALPEAALGGEVVRISPVVDPATGCFTVQVKVDSPGDGVQLMPGMFARVSLIGKK